MRCFSQSLKGPIAKSWQQEPPTPHDLRRTLNSRLARMRIPKEVRSAALGHVPRRSDVEGRHYLVHEFEKEKREALGKWAAEIEALITPAAMFRLLRDGGDDLRGRD
jgi:integrase